MAQEAEQLSALLAQTLDPTPGVRASAEQNLVSLSTSSPQHIPNLLQIIAQGTSQSHIRLAAAIHLKNIIRTRWDAEDAQDAGLPPVDDNTKQALRQNLLPLLFSLSAIDNAAPLPLRSQLNASLALVAQHDFPRAWTGLLDEIVQQLAPQSSTTTPPDLGIVQACFSTLHQVTKAWRGQFRSDKLYEEINYVLGKFAPVWWNSIQQTNQALLDPATPQSHIKPLLQVLHLQVVLFYDLSCQDLPPLFEDNIAPISQLLLHWLSYAPPQYQPDNEDEDDDKPDELTLIRAAICEAAELYAQRYLDAWEPQVAGFVQAVWEMLGKLQDNNSSRHNVLLSRALAFLSIIVRQPSLRHLFSQGGGGGGGGDGSSVMESLVQRVVLPNVGIKESEEEMFEDEPLAWVKREIEGSTETDTPRLSSLAFLRSLLEHFTQDITRIISSYIQSYLEQYKADPASQWQKKDAAIWLMTGVAARGATKHGVSQQSTNNLVDVVQFFSDHVYSDLQASEASGTVHPILKVDAIRYLHTFRNQLTKEQLLSVLPLLVQHLQSDNVGIHTYAAVAIERILVIRGGEQQQQQQQLLFTPQDVQPFAEQMLLALFGKIQAGSTPEKVAENEFLMKGVMRVLTTTREQLAGAYSILLQHLGEIITTIAKNPSNPRFSQFAFESLAALVRFTTAADPSSLDGFEQALFPPFTAILQGEVAEFVPYVFQLLSQLLEMRPAGELPASYQSLLPSLLTPALWQSRGNVPALVRLVQAYLSKAAGAMVSNNQIPAVLGIYQQLIASRVNDEFGFELMQTVFEYVEESALQPYKSAVMTLMLTRLQNSRTEKFSKGFVTFVATLACLSKAGYPEGTMEAFDSVQPGLFTQLLEGVLIAEIPKIPQRKRRVVIVGFTRLLTQSTRLQQQSSTWSKTFSAILKLLSDTSIENKTIEAQQAENDENFIEEWEEQNIFQAGFSKLANSTSNSVMVSPVDTLVKGKSSEDLKTYLAQEVAKGSQRQPGVLGPLCEGLTSEAKVVLQGVLSEKGVQIV
ncbi:unnamed protein product [Sympodiomycopsis kandeliae]